MSKIVMQATDFDDDINWIEKAIEKKYIKYYDHSEFTHTKPMDESSSVGSIFRANWKDTDTLLVVKTPSELTVKEIINEVSNYVIIYFFLKKKIMKISFYLIIFINFITA